MLNKSLNMELGSLIKKVREAKGLSQKELALSCNMDQAQYSRIENGKTDPAFSAVARIAKGLGIELSDLFKDDLLRDPNSYDRSLMEKIALIDKLSEDQKKSLFTFIDLAISNKKMKDSLSNILTA